MPRPAPVRPKATFRLPRAAASSAVTARTNRRVDVRSEYPPLSLSAVPWRFLHVSSDSNIPVGPVISQEGLRYIEEDAERWKQRTQNSHPTPTTDDLIGRRPLCTVPSLRAGLVEAYGDHISDDDDDPPTDRVPLAEFNPFSNSFVLPPASARSSVSLPPAFSGSSLQSPTVGSAPVDVSAEVQASADEEERRKRKGLIASDLLSHYANKDVVDDERERTRKRERSKWEHSDTRPTFHSDNDGGGILVGGLGLDSEDAAPAPPMAGTDGGEDAGVAALLEEAGKSRAGDEMPDISDFIKLYEDEDEPSYPAMMWKTKERLTQATDVPQQIVDELSRASGTRTRKKAEDSQPRLRFNLGEGKDYIEEEEEDSRKGSRALLLPTIHPGRSVARRYGRQWYLPVSQWQVSEEHKERMELSRSEDETTGSLPNDAYHGDEWRDKLAALRQSLPALYCSQAFKAFLLRHNPRTRLPHYLHPVQSLDPRKEEDEEKRALALALAPPIHPTPAPATKLRAVSVLGEGGLPQPAVLVAAMPKRGKDDGQVGDEDGEGIGDEEGDADLIEYMREVRLREVSLAGVKLVKEREREIEEREKRKKEREKARLRAANVWPPGAGVDMGIEDGEEEVDLDKLFDVPPYDTRLFN